MKVKEKTVSIPAPWVREINGLLDSDKPDPKSDKDGIIEEFVVSFDNGYMALIKVCNGDGPYIDPVLFEGKHDGKFMQYYECTLMEPQFILNGTYMWEYPDVFGENIKYVVNVKAVEGLDKTTIT